MFVCLFVSLESVWMSRENCSDFIHDVYTMLCISAVYTPHTDKKYQSALCAGSDSPMTLPTRDYDGGGFLIHVE